MIKITMMLHTVVAIVASILVMSLVVLGAPQQAVGTNGKPTTTTTAAATSTQKPTTLSPVSSTTSKQQVSVAASALAASPSLVNIAPNNEVPSMDSESMSVFDGKNPFADDSLWQIPVHLVRDMSASEGSADKMDKLASDDSRTDADEDTENESIGYSHQPAAPLQQSSSNSPTVISASTDLKTAAGYHYPTHGGQHGYGHESHGYEGGHHGADHYGGKYFQYAKVPYPYAWEFGYRRGNPYHTIERYEHGKGPHFQTKVKWSDKHGGYGVHVWDYNHDDHHSHHYGGHYDSHEPAHHGYGSGHHGASHYGHH